MNGDNRPTSTVPIVQSNGEKAATVAVQAQQSLFIDLQIKTAGE
jgi:hypothetical protein